MGTRISALSALAAASITASTVLPAVESGTTYKTTTAALRTALLAGGASYTAGDYLSLGATPSTAGTIRLANAATIGWRNAANGANQTIALNGSDLFAFTAGVTITGALSASGDFAIATNKLTVASATGNTLVAGTLSVTSDVAVNTNKFTVAASTGNTLVAGTLSVTSDFAVATNKFTVAASSGNTVVAGTLNVTGTLSATLSGNVTGNVTGNLTGNVTGNVSGTSGSTTGNAATATILATARNINGVSFNGSASITIGFAAADITGTTLAASVVNASINNLSAGLTTAGNIVATASDITAGGTVTGTSMISTAATQGATFRTTFGSTSIPNNTATTIFTGTAGSMYLVFIFDASGNAVGSATFLADSAGTNGLTGNLSVAGNFSFSVSGAAFKVTHTLGSTKTISWSAIRVA